MGSDSDNIKRTDPAALAHLLDTTPSLKDSWTGDEIGAILRHQLSVAIHSDLGAAAIPLDASPALRCLLLKSYDDLFRDPTPSKELLDLIRRNVKRRRSDPNSMVPREVLAALYYAAIIAARVRLGERLTELSDDDLLKGLNWLLARPWIDGSLRQLLGSGAAVLDANKASVATDEAKKPEGDATP